jgi:hypothetical protein
MFPHIMNNEIEDIYKILYLTAYCFFTILISAYFLRNSKKLQSAAINFNFFLWPATIISFAAAMNFYALGFEVANFYLTIANALYIFSAGLLTVILVDISQKRSFYVIASVILFSLICIYFYEIFRRSGEIQLRHFIVSLALVAIYSLGFLLTFKHFWKKSILPNLRFISVLLFVSVIFYGFLCAVSMVGYVYPEWASIYELIFSKGIRIISIAINIFLFLSVGNYLFEQALVIESQKSVDSEMQMLNSLNALAYARDNETGNHIIRTQKYVEALAMRLSRVKKFSEILSSVNIALLHNAAPLHDIGKVGIPDSILHKPAKLTDSEWEIMKTHTTIGENVLTSAEVDSRHKSSLLLFATQIAGGHHEKWDGSGYPRGLSGADIPLAARIMSLADMYDALLSKRVYKEAWSHEDAAREIRSRSGTHFDPEVVDAFIVEQDRFQEISIQYRD